MDSHASACRDAIPLLHPRCRRIIFIIDFAQAFDLLQFLFKLSLLSLGFQFATKLLCLGLFTRQHGLHQDVVGQ